MTIQINCIFITSCWSVIISNNGSNWNFEVAVLCCTVSKWKSGFCFSHFPNSIISSTLSKWMTFSIRWDCVIAIVMNYCFRWLNYYSFGCLFESKTHSRPTFLDEWGIFVNWKWIFSVWNHVDFELHRRKWSYDHLLHSTCHHATTQKTWPNAQDSATGSGNCFNKCKEFTSATLNVVVHLPYFNRAKIYFRMHKFMLRRRSMLKLMCVCVCEWMYGPNLWCSDEWQNWLN